MKVFAALEPGKTGFVDIPIPEPGEDEALVKIEGCVICNTTDWMVINSHFGAPDFPVAIGHESIGRVIKLGSKVKNLRLGDRVTRANAIPSGTDGKYYSAWGGFSEYGIVKDKSEIKGLNDLPLKSAGLLIALSETASCLMQLGSIQGKTVLVTGTGAAGLSLVYFAKQFGAGKVLCMGRRAVRLELAKRLGADEVYLQNGNELKQAVNAGIEADYVFEATGKYDVFKDGIPLLKNKGILAIYGTPEKPYIINAEKSPSNYSRIELTPKEELAYEFVCDLLHRDADLCDIFMTHSWRYDELQEAFEQVREGIVVKGMVLMA